MHLPIGSSNLVSPIIITSVDESGGGGSLPSIIDGGESGRDVKLA